MPSFANNLRSSKVLSSTRKRSAPLWEGPDGSGSNGGVTQSLLSRWLVCRERSRLLLVDGLKAGERFSKSLFYGSAWHVCEEAHASGTDHAEALEEYAKGESLKFPFDRLEVDKWYRVCKIQFPEYVKFWAKHPDVANRTPLLQEHEFSVPYQLSSGRTVRLRGKWDSVDLVTEVKKSVKLDAMMKNADGIWLQENKSKGEVDEEQLKRELSSGFFLQPMFYLVALQQDQKLAWKDAPLDMDKRAWAAPIRGVRWNVVRRPLSGGKGTIVRKEATRGSKCPKCKGEQVITKGAFTGGCPKCKGVGRIGAKPAETEEAYWERVAAYIKDEPESYFLRWNVEVSEADLKRFRKECLDVILEQLCWWWDQVTYKGDSPAKNDADLFHHWGVPPINFVFPFGVFSWLLDGGETEYDQCIKTGSRAGLIQTDVLFPELGTTKGGK